MNAPLHIRGLSIAIGRPLVHDLENVGETRLRFVTVELKH